MKRILLVALITACTFSLSYANKGGKAIEVKITGQCTEVVKNKNGTATATFKVEINGIDAKGNKHSREAMMEVEYKNIEAAPAEGWSWGESNAGLVKMIPNAGGENKSFTLKGRTQGWGPIDDSMLLVKSPGIYNLFEAWPAKVK